MFDTVLLPIDLNHPESWQKALPMALKITAPGGTLHLLGIVHDMGAALVSSYFPADFEKHAMEKTKADLAQFAATHVPADVTCDVHVGHGHVAERILDAAGKIGADVVVMASHPPDDLRDFLIGSNADRVVRHARLPVLVVR